MIDYAKRLDEIEVELSKWPYRAHNEAAFSDAISIARALLKERDELTDRLNAITKAVVEQCVAESDHGD